MNTLLHGLGWTKKAWKLLQRNHIVSNLKSFQGEFFNDEEVRIMIAREAEEERNRRDEELAKEIEEEAQAKKEEGVRKKRGIIIAN